MNISVLSSISYSFMDVAFLSALSALAGKSWMAMTSMAMTGSVGQRQRDGTGTRRDQR